MTKVLIFPVVMYAVIYWVCYDIFLWAVFDERSPWTRKLNMGKGPSTPIADAMDFARDLVDPASWR